MLWRAGEQRVPFGDNSKPSPFQNSQSKAKLAAEMDITSPNAPKSQHNATEKADKVRSKG